MAEDGASRRFFDVWARVYDNPVVQAVTYRPVQNAVLRAVREQGHRRVLDVGCGTGQLTVRLVDEAGAEAIGCDYSFGMLEQARRRSMLEQARRRSVLEQARRRSMLEQARRRSVLEQARRQSMLEQARRRSVLVPWVQGDALHLPVRRGGVDAVVCTESFHWYPDQPAALEELARVLAPGGRIYVALVNPPSLLVSRVTARWSRRAGQPFRWPTPREMRAMVEGAGLRVVRQRPVLRLPAGPVLPPVLTIAARPD